MVKDLKIQTIQYDKMDIFIFLVIGLTLSHISVAENKTFVPTAEWQEIAEGQEIPRGLHVRINLKTGKKEARIIDDTEDTEESYALSAVPDLDSESEEDYPTKRKEKGSPNKHPFETNDNNVRRLDKIKNWKNVKESTENSSKKYKKHYESLRKNFRTDGEVLTKLMEEMRNNSKLIQDSDRSESDRIQTMRRDLENLGNLVNQIDNSLIFIDRGGLDELLPLVINQTHIDLRIQAMHVLGTLTQNNKNAQIAVFEYNFGPYLSQRLISSTNCPEVSTALFAFGSLLREYPLAQEHILSTHGTQALIAVLYKECELKVKAKAVTLISDLIVEKHVETEPTDESASEINHAKKLYAKVHFSKWLQRNGYCEAMDTLFSNKIYELIEDPNTTEYFVQALKNTRNECEVLWSQSPQLRHTLLTLKNRYMQSKSEYPMDVAKQIDEVFTQLYRQGMPHEEL